MSAYICNPEHIGVLAAYAAAQHCAIQNWRHASEVGTAQSVAQGLVRANIAAVAYRYPNDVDGSRPGPGLLDADIEKAVALYAAHFVIHPERLTPIAVIKLCRGLGYQSCDRDDWTVSLAWRQLDCIMGNAVRALNGYEDADWSFDKTIPAVAALYDKS